MGLSWHATSVKVLTMVASATQSAAHIRLNFDAIHIVWTHRIFYQKDIMVANSILVLFD